MKTIDRLTGGIPTGRLVTIFGHQGSYRNHVARMVASQAAVSEGISTAFFTSMFAHHTAALIVASVARVPFARVMLDSLGPDDQATFDRAWEQVAGSSLRLCGGQALRAQDVIAIALDETDMAPRLVIVDNIPGLIGDQREAAVEFGRAARKHDVAILVVTREDKDAWIWRHQSDITVRMERPSQDLCCAAVALRGIGEVGVVSLLWDGSQLLERPQYVGNLPGGAT